MAYALQFNAKWAFKRLVKMALEHALLGALTYRISKRATPRGMGSYGPLA